jgi:hypothetical protein
MSARDILIKKARAYRSKTTGQFTKPLYELYLHDLGNLAVQLITCSEDKSELDRQADSINQLFMLAGRGETFQAQVVESNETEGEMTYSDELYLEGRGEK